MAVKVYTGKDVKITFGDIVARFKGIKIKVMGSKFEATASDSNVLERGTGTYDASIAITGWDSDDTGASDFDKVAAMVLSGQAPTALTYTDDAGTPASRLPSNFFTLFPLNRWKVDDAEGGTDGPGDPAQWVVNLTPNNLDVVPAA